MYKILFVTPDQSKLENLLSKVVKKTINFLIVESLSDGLLELSTGGYDGLVVFSRMNIVEGYEFLRKAKYQFPAVIRVMVGAPSDDFIMVKALRENTIHYYMSTPLKYQLLEKKIISIIETNKSLANTNIDKLLTNQGGLPTIKSSYLKVIQHIDNGDEIPLVVNEIQKDHALTSTILRIANSAYYNLKTLSVFKAITYLGLSNVRNLVQATAIIESFVIRTKDRELVQSIWNHSFETMQFLAVLNRRVLKLRDFDIIATAGLLHRVGIPMLLSVFKDDYSNILGEMNKQKNINISDLEIERFQCNHGDMGAFLLNSWDLPFPIVEATYYYERPDHPDLVNESLVSAIHLASMYTWNPFYDGENSYETVHALKTLGLTQDDMKQLLIHYAKEKTGSI